MKNGFIDLDNAISRALKFIEGERDEIVAQKDAAISKFQDITDKQKAEKYKRSALQERLKGDTHCTSRSLCSITNTK
eukprot:14308685-Ditylum_brightwellii.AAC.1